MSKSQRTEERKGWLAKIGDFFTQAFNWISYRFRLLGKKKCSDKR
jgi:hypothetical protein